MSKYDPKGECVFTMGFNEEDNSLCGIIYDEESKKGIIKMMHLDKSYKEGASFEFIDKTRYVFGDKFLEKEELTEEQNFIVEEQMLLDV
jgi:hypothetical protein